MTFSSTITGKTIIGNKRFHWGTYTNGGGDTGGDVTTALSYVEHFQLQQRGTAVTTGAPVVNETFPRADGITIVTDDGADGQWFAIGR